MMKGLILLNRLFVMKIRKLSYPILVALCFVSVCCSGNNKNNKEEYIVRGTTSQTRLNGQKVYLVPYGSPLLEDSLGVDSVVIRDGKFEFRGNKGEFLARVTIDIKHRYGTQDLLVVTEPGVTSVVIDSISSSSGTPQNDMIQWWKELKTEHDRIQWNQSRHISYLKEHGDTAYAVSLTDSLEQFNKDYLSRVHRLMRMVGSGPAYDFLRDRYGNPD